jgi:hypothetical protein
VVILSFCLVGSLEQAFLRLLIVQPVIEQCPKSEKNFLSFSSLFKGLDN